MFVTLRSCFVPSVKSFESSGGSNKYTSPNARPGRACGSVGRMRVAPVVKVAETLPDTRVLEESEPLPPSNALARGVRSLVSHFETLSGRKLATAPAASPTAAASSNTAPAANGHLNTIQHPNYTPPPEVQHSPTFLSQALAPAAVQQPVAAQQPDVAQQHVPVKQPALPNAALPPTPAPQATPAPNLNLNPGRIPSTSSAPTTKHPSSISGTGQQDVQLRGVFAWAAVNLKEAGPAISVAAGLGSAVVMAGAVLSHTLPGPSNSRPPLRGHASAAPPPKYDGIAVALHTLRATSTAAASQEWASVPRSDPLRSLLSRGRPTVITKAAARARAALGPAVTGAVPRAGNHAGSREAGRSNSGAGAAAPSSSNPTAAGGTSAAGARTPSTRTSPTTTTTATTTTAYASSQAENGQHPTLQHDGVGQISSRANPSLLTAPEAQDLGGSSGVLQAVAAVTVASAVKVAAVTVTAPSPPGHPSDTVTAASDEGGWDAAEGMELAYYAEAWETATAMPATATDAATATTAATTATAELVSTAAPAAAAGSPEGDEQSGPGPALRGGLFGWFSGLFSALTGAASAPQQPSPPDDSALAAAPVSPVSSSSSVGKVCPDAQAQADAAFAALTQPTKYQNSSSASWQPPGLTAAQPPSPPAAAAAAGMDGRAAMDAQFADLAMPKVPQVDAAAAAAGEEGAAGGVAARNPVAKPSGRTRHLARAKPASATASATAATAAAATNPTSSSAPSTSTDTASLASSRFSNGTAGTRKSVVRGRPGFAQPLPAPTAPVPMFLSASNPEVHEPLAQLASSAAPQAVAAGVAAFKSLGDPELQGLRDAHSSTFGLLASAVTLAAGFGVPAWRVMYLPRLSQLLQEAKADVPRLLKDLCALTDLRPLHKLLAGCTADEVLAVLVALTQVVHGPGGEPLAFEVAPDGCLTALTSAQVRQALRTQV